jgi:hypothetical protein
MGLLHQTPSAAVKSDVEDWRETCAYVHTADSMGKHVDATVAAREAFGRCARASGKRTTREMKPRDPSSTHSSHKGPTFR